MEGTETIRIDLLEDHARQMQGKEQFDALVKLAQEVKGGYRLEEFKADITRAHNISEHILKVMAEEHKLEPINVKTMALVIYNVVYGALASAPGVGTLYKFVSAIENIQLVLPGLVIKKMLGK